MSSNYFDGNYVVTMNTTPTLSTRLHPQIIMPIPAPAGPAAAPQEDIPVNPVSFNHEYPTIVQSIIAAGKLSGSLSQEAVNKISQCLDYKVRSTVITLLQDPKKFNQLPILRQQFTNQSEALRQLCLTTQPNLHESQIEAITTAISQQAKTLAVKISVVEKRQVISEWLNGRTSRAEQLSGSALEVAYRQCLSDKHLANSVTVKLEKLIDLANIPTQFQPQYTLGIAYSQTGDEPDDGFAINVSEGNYALGYGLFDLLRSQNLHVYHHDDYNGETVFPLTRAQLAKLNEHIEELNKWYDDFLCIVGDLLGYEDTEAGDASAQFVSIGQKSSSEVLDNPIHLSAQCQGLFATLAPQQPCLLFNTLSINLASHSDRIFLKQKFESIYEEENIIGANRRLKQFIGDTFSTNLNVEQLRIISPHLNKLLKLQQLLTDVTNTKSLGKAVIAYKRMDLGEHELDPLRSFKASLLYEIYQEIKGPDKLAFLTIERSLENITRVPSLEAKAQAQCESILKTHSVCCFPESEDHPAIDDGQIIALYGNQERNITYAGGQLHRNIPALCAALQNSRAYQHYKTSNPAIDAALTILKNDLLHRLNSYAAMSSRIGNERRYILDEAIDYFESFVGLLFYGDDYRLTSLSISEALHNLAAITDSGLDGCNQGLSGRIQSLLMPLVATTGNKIKDSIRQFQKNGVTASVAKAIGHSNESSMWARCLDEVNDFLGLAVIPGLNPNHAFGHLSRISKLTISHLLHEYYTPVSLYRHVYQFVSDEFWRLNHEKNDSEIYQLLHLLGFETNQTTTVSNTDYQRFIDRKYRVRGNALNRWQYAFFQQDLPKYLVSYLLKEKYISATQATQGTVHIPREGLVFGRNTVSPPSVGASETEQNFGQDNRQIGFVPESRIAQASYRTETS